LKHPYINEKTIGEVSEILRSGDLSLYRGSPAGHDGGYWVQKLEELIRETFNVKYAVVMNSATACLHSALLALGIGEEDEVIVSPYSFVSSASCTLMVGATPVFCDIEDETFCVDVDKLEITNSSNFRAIIPVDLCGHPADYDKIKKLNIPIIQDSAQAIGGKYKGQFCGLQGDCGIYSFNQSKQVSSGEGGALVTNNNEIYLKARAIRNHAEVSMPELNLVGYNYRLNEVEACIVYNQLLDLENNIGTRRELCQYMSSKLSDIEGIIPPIDKEYHSYYTYAVKWEREGSRDKFQKKMIDKGLYFGMGYVKPLYRLSIFNSDIRLPVVERMYETIMVTDQFRYPMTKKDCDRYLEGINECLT